MYLYPECRAEVTIYVDRSGCLLRLHSKHHPFLSPSSGDGYTELFLDRLAGGQFWFLLRDGDDHTSTSERTGKLEDILDMDSLSGPTIADAFRTAHLTRTTAQVLLMELEDYVELTEEEWARMQGQAPE